MTGMPWMPLYVSDYLADTGHLSAVEHGAYLLLIMHYWQSGGLPNDDAKLARIARLSMKEWAKVRDTISEFFDDNWNHKRIEEEIEIARVKTEKRTAAGRAGASARYSKRIANAEQKDTHPQSQLPKEEKKEEGADAPFAFIGRVIRINNHDFDRWKASFPNLDLRGQLEARDAFLADLPDSDNRRKNWFASTAADLRNKNEAARANQKPKEVPRGAWKEFKPEKPPPELTPEEIARREMQVAQALKKTTKSLTA